MRRLAFMAVSVLAFAGCHERDNPLFCEGHPGDSSCNDAGSGNTHCQTNADCVASPTDSVCDTANNGGTCVGCDADHKDACTGMTPVCNVTAETCNACVTDADCAAGAATGVCLPSGACVPQGNIIHVTSGGSNASDCGDFTKPCTLDRGRMNVAGAKNVLRLDDDGPFNNNGFTLDADVTIDARGATNGAVIHRSGGSGTLVQINGGRTVTILGGNLQAAMNDGINCNGTPTASTLTVVGTIIEMNGESAIDATGCALTLTKVNLRMNNPVGGLNPALKLSGGSIVLSQSLITNNRGGGLSSNDTTFKIVGNLFRANGDPSGGPGGMSVATTLPSNRIEFNTVIENIAQPTATAGITCNADATLIAFNNVVWKNNSAVSGGLQVGGGCPHAYSFIGPTPPSTLLDMGHNSSADPQLVDVMTDAHPMHTSPIHYTSLPSADLTGIASQDLDNKPRVAGPGGVGADPGAYVVP